MLGHRLRSAVVLEAAGEHRASKAALQEAIALADGQRLRWAFVDVPAALRLLRRDAPRRSSFTDDALVHLAGQMESRGRGGKGLVAPLTERELTVLEYLPRRIRNQDIADDLYITVNTLKSHLRGIYRKLGVADRDEAITRANQLGLL